MQSIPGAAAAYVAIVFAAGFVLGTLRVLVLAPLLGSLGAVLIELPIILAVSWWACGVVLAGSRVADAVRSRLQMGIAAFAMLMAAEALLGLVMPPLAETRLPEPPYDGIADEVRRRLSSHVAGYRQPDRLLGLAGQVAFALFPLTRRVPARPSAG
jgi:hypothetical protein